MEFNITIHLACGKEMQIKYIDTSDEVEQNSSSEFEDFMNNNNLNFNVID